MVEPTPASSVVHADAGTCGLVAPQAEGLPEPGVREAALTEARRAALAEAAALARNANALATLRAYRSDCAHYTAWCAAMCFVPVPAEPSVVGAYLASLTDKAPTTPEQSTSPGQPGDGDEDGRQ